LVLIPSLGAATAAAISNWLIFIFTISIAYGRIRYLRSKGAASGGKSYELVDKNAAEEVTGDRSRLNL